MIALIQRVRAASVEVDQQIVGRIDAGLLALIGVQKDDDYEHAERLLDKMLAYRVFADDAQRMNRSLRDTGGGLLLVSQFTLAADTTLNAGTVAFGGTLGGAQALTINATGTSFGGAGGVPAGEQDCHTIILC